MLLANINVLYSVGLLNGIIPPDRTCYVHSALAIMAKLIWLVVMAFPLLDAWIEDASAQPDTNWQN